MAQDLCAAGLVLLNRQRAKSAHTVKAGDMISMRRADREIVVRVLQVPETRSVSREAARQMIEIVSEKPTLPSRDWTQGCAALQNEGPFQLFSWL